MAVVSELAIFVPNFVSNVIIDCAFAYIASILAVSLIFNLSFNPAAEPAYNA